MKKCAKLQFIIALFILSSFNSFSQVNVNINANSNQFAISEYLTGIHTVYFWDADSVYEKDNYELARWAKNAGISTMRFPGGSTVKTWDWQNPSGQKTNSAVADPWNPNFNGIYEPDSLWMSLDEYLTFVDSSGIMPLFGVNFNSGKLYNRIQESVDRAVAMVNYVKNRGYGGAFWYIGNEDHMEDASLFKQHAEAMKVADPNIKCIWNNNHITTIGVTNFLAVAGSSADGVEAHRKWPDFGVNGTVADWRAQKGPRPDGRNLRTFANTIRQAGINAGYPNFMVMDNEYGLAGDGNLIGFDRYSASLVVIDQLQEHFIGNWDMACYWSNLTWTNQDFQMLLSRDNNLRRHATQYGLELLAMAEGAIMLDHTETGGGTTTYGFAAKKGNDTLFYMLNKDSIDHELSVTFAEGTPVNYSATLPAMSYSRIVWSNGAVSGKVLQSTPDEFGELADLNVSITNPPIGNELVFYPSDDAFVSQQYPSTNFGSDTTLHYKGRANKNHHSYLKFNVSGITDSVVSATLKLKNLQYAAIDATVYIVSNTTWTEGAITWNNKPGMGQALQTITGLNADTAYSFDVTSQITGNGVFSLGIKTTDTNGIARLFSSKEGSVSPVLEIICSTSIVNPTYYVDNVGANSRMQSNTSGTDAEGTSVTETSSHARWQTIDAGGGYVYLQCEANSNRLNAVSNVTLDGSSIELADSTFTGDGAKWLLTKTGSNYFVNNKAYSSRRLNMANSSVISLGETNWSGSWVQWSITDTQTGLTKSANITNNSLKAEEKISLDIYPNPVKSLSTIQYKVTQSSNVKLSIYNMQGQRIDVLQNGYQQIGRHEKTIDVSDLASGLYIVRLVVDTGNLGKLFTETKRFVIQK